jgi:hypothetical protein
MGDNDLYLNIPKLQELMGETDTALGIDLVICIWAPGKQPFRYEPERLAEQLRTMVPGRKYTTAYLRERETEAALFFTILPDGRWAPRPDLFSLSDEPQ